MKFHFDPNQKFQLDAIRSIVDIFDGQTLKTGEFSIVFEDDQNLFHTEYIGNNLKIGKDQILENLQEVQKQNELQISKELDGMNFSVEMETGTGKTYVYLRTICELNRKYGFKKFVITVPSIAIKEGVLKNLEITHEHFQNLYDNVPVDYFVYESKNVSKLRQFASSNTIQILVINIDSFAKDENIINRANDKLVGKKPIEFVRGTHPIVIVDEPQNMETEKRKKAIENLSPLCTLRYSATHTNLYNLVYSLDPVKAYDLGLVKQIEVDSIVTENDFNDAYVLLERITAGKTHITAKLRIDAEQVKGAIRKSVTVKIGDDLYRKSNQRQVYFTGYKINSIDAENGYIEFSNGKSLFLGNNIGSNPDELLRVQIEKAVEEHFCKEQRFSGKGIKVLSLFFIDRVMNYRGYDATGNPVKGKYALWFEEAFKKNISKDRFKGIIPFDVEQVHNGYFAQDKKGHWKNTKGISKADDDTYHLIMKDKEKLLDIAEPLRFIFSHSALREGWDNPNVFQICTLNETRSELKKRQEIGRGMRLPVNQQGERIQDKNINHLTVIANESYEDFAKTLQMEIEKDCGVSFGSRIKNKAKRKTVKYRKGFELDDKFKEIWERIKYKTSYKVEYDSSDLIEKAAMSVRRMPEINRAKIKVSKAIIDINKKGISTTPKSSRVVDSTYNIRIPNILFYIEQRIGLTRSTIWEILNSSERSGDILINPQMFLDNAVNAIQDVLFDLMIDGIKYEKFGDLCYEMHLFEDFDIHVNDLTFSVSDKEKTIYKNLLPLDSGVEYEFAQECESREDIEFYFKLPSWFKIKTPIGNYNPDWALIKKNEKTVYFVAETKSAGQELRESEKRKIRCGYAHFNEFENVEYKQVTTVQELD